MQWITKKTEDVCIYVYVFTKLPAAKVLQQGTKLLLG
jgi:hypothetical protein